MHILLLPGILLALFTVYTLWKAWTSPLRRIPGPWYTHFTHLVLKKHVMTGHRLHYIHELHQRYGDTVRLSPTEIDIAAPKDYKIVHNIVGGFPKDLWYHSFTDTDIRGIFDMIDPKQHAERRRLFAPLWTYSALRDHWDGMVADKVREAVSKIRRDALAGEADVFQWWTFMTTDVISHLAFGEDLGMLKQEGWNQYIRDVEMATKIGGFLAEFQLLKPIVRALPLAAVQNALASNKRVQTYGEAAIRRAKAEGMAKQNVFSRIMAEEDSGKATALSEYQIASEAGNFIVAGSGTTAVTLTYLVWCVLNDAEVQRKLEEEVAALPASYEDAQLTKLPYLSAVIDETLRLCGAAPGSLPRTVPTGGATLGGFFIPEGMTVSSQAYTLHRNEDVYREAETFNPSRFIDAEGTYTPTKVAWAPFGAGTRTCLGIHLARMELRHGTAEFFRQCRGARIADSMKPSDMEMMNYFLISPRGDKCCITLN